jgi:hypothetical protein
MESEKASPNVFGDEILAYPAVPLRERHPSYPAEVCIGPSLVIMVAPLVEGTRFQVPVVRVSFNWIALFSGQ